MIANFVKEKTNSFLTILILLLTLIVLFSIILASFFGYPIAMGDKEGFYPVIFNLFEKNQFIHPFLCHLCENYVSNWSNIPWTNHGFLYPTLLSKFIIFNEYERVELTVIFFLIFNLFFCMKIILDKSINSYLIYIVFFALNLFQVGRPELLVTTVLLIDLYFSKKKLF